MHRIAWPLSVAAMLGGANLVNADLFGADLTDARVCQPEKRKVDSSILSLTTSLEPVSSALTSANADSALSCPQPSSDHDCPCVTVVGRSLSHANRTSCLGALAKVTAAPVLRF